MFFSASAPLTVSRFLSSSELAAFLTSLSSEALEISVLVSASFPSIDATAAISASKSFLFSALFNTDSSPVSLLEIALSVSSFDSDCPFSAPFSAIEVVSITASAEDSSLTLL